METEEGKQTGNTRLLKHAIQITFSQQDFLQFLHQFLHIWHIKIIVQEHIYKYNFIKIISLVEEAWNELNHLLIAITNSIKSLC